VIADSETDTVYISDLLAERFPTVDRDLRAVLGNRLREISGARDIWCRDYMPIQIERGRFVQFRYDPAYLRAKKYQHLHTPDGASLLQLPNCTYSNLVVDGGNIVHWRDAVIITERLSRRTPASSGRVSSPNCGKL